MIVAAPGGRVVDGDWPASALVVELQRAVPRPREEVELPAPLAEPRLDFRVDKASALAYEVREGEYIQIIDVAGRQCSDFLAFHAHKLDAGVERGLDPQVTRTLMGTAYPTVGLHSKYYDADMDPLCQVVQDTVGRHDSFALACTARYYEDLGYPGHVNCTRELQPPGRALRRRGEEGLGGAQLLLQHLVRPGPGAALRRAVVAPGRLRAAAGAVGPRLRVVGLPGRHRPGQRLGGHRHPRPRLLTGEPLLDGHRPPRHPGGRARADQGDGVPLPLVGADPQRDRVPRLLAADLLHERGRRQRVLGLPREGRRDGPLPPAQVGDPRARRRAAHADRGDARHPPAGGRPGRLHGDVQRDRRHGRRRDRVPARAGQLPLRRRRRVRRRAPAPARRARGHARVDQADHRRAAQPRRPGAAQPRHPQGDRLVAARPAAARGAALVPLPDRPAARLRRRPGDRLADRLQRRARLRGVLPPVATARRSGTRS